MRRSFNKSEKTALYILSDGKCEICGIDLEKGWHADHVKPYSKGGDTDIINAQALCPECNLKKGAKYMNDDRYKWQERCFMKWKEVYDQQKSFLVASTPASGKTRMALRIAKYLIDNEIINRLFVIVPTEHLKTQWAEVADKHFKLNLDHKYKNTPNFEEARDYDGIVITYQGLASSPLLHRKLNSSKDTFAIFDEIHHAGDDKSWGTSVFDAGEVCKHILLLSGTPFRSDNNEISFIKYDNVENDSKIIKVSNTDHPYGFKYTHGEAVRDKNVKRFNFPYVDGLQGWIYNEKKYEYKLSDDCKDDFILSHRLRTAFEITPDSHISQWLEEVLTRANETLDHLRKYSRHDSGGLIFVESIFKAQCFETNKKIHKLLGEKPSVVYSEKKDSGTIIEDFRNGETKWLVSVNQVSEGIDIPRLSVGVLASNEKTKMIFMQRALRLGRIEDIYPENKEAWLYIPADNDFKKLAEEIIKEQDHEIKEPGDGPPPPPPRTKYEFIPIDSRDNKVEGLIYNGKYYQSDDDLMNELREDAGISIDDASLIRLVCTLKDKGYIKTGNGETKQKYIKTLANRKTELKDKIKTLLPKITYKYYIDLIQDPSRKPMVYTALNTALNNYTNVRSRNDATEEELNNTIDIIGKWLLEDNFELDKMFRALYWRFAK